MPKLDICVQDEQKVFEADVAAIEKQWSSARQSHLKRYVALSYPKRVDLFRDRIQLTLLPDHTLRAP